MEARVHDTTEAFRSLAEPLLAADPIRQTIMLTAVARVGDDGVKITLHDNGNLVGALVRSPPYPLITSAMPLDAADVAAEAVRTVNPRLSGASGPLNEVGAFADAWTRLTGATAEVVFSTRLFKLGELKTPTVDGSARWGTEDDLALMADWRHRFHLEARPGVGVESPLEQAKTSLKPGSVNIIWEVDGTPVAYAGARGPIAGMTRVAPVYTPPEFRGHGYASAATAAATQWAIDQGSEHVLLFTDLTNPVTNRIYPRIGYQPLEDSAEYEFTMP
jgi:GNAT superfamily N-acetyltransferase